MLDSLDRLVDAMENAEIRPSRRLLFGAGAVGLAALAPLTATAASPGNIPSQNWRHPAVRLARRITFGVNKAEHDNARLRGFANYLEYQLNFTAIDDSVCEAEVARRWPRLRNTPAQNCRLGDDWKTVQQLVESTIYRGTFSRRQLYERMVEFWTDHFNVYVWKPGGPMTVDMLQTAIRPHAMGNFPNLLRAVARSGAMLHYLDNVLSWGDSPNVNFARELMELHTISVNGGYTQADVRQVALCFTGWTIEWDCVNKPNGGRFLYRPEAHARGNKTVLGQVIPEGGVTEGERVLNILGLHRNTARFIVRKLCRFFLGAELPTSEIETIATVFVNSKGDIRRVLRMILTEPNVMNSPPVFKRPYHLMINGIRCSRPTLNEFWTLRYDHLEQAGHHPYHWEPPDGFPLKFEFWGDAMAPRLDYAFTLANNRIWGVRTDVVPRLGNPRDVNSILTKINHDYFGGEMSNVDRDGLLRFLQAAPITDERIRATVALALASPSFQWC